MSISRWRRATAATATSLIAATLLTLAPGASAMADEAECTVEDQEPITPDYGKVSEEAIAANGTPWAQSQLNVDRLGAYATGKGVKVAVLDSGVDGDHKLFGKRVETGKALINVAGEAKKGDGNVDCFGHGTGVAGIIAASLSKETGFQGIAPKATILPIRVSVEAGGPIDPEEDEEAEDPPVTPEDVAGAIDDAVAADSDVINLSLAYGEDHPALAASIADAISAGVVVVASAGNSQGEEPACKYDRDTQTYQSPATYPADYPGVIGVGAVDKTITKLPTSRCGDWVDLVAPGNGLVTTRPDDTFTNEMGATSSAAAFVSGTAALLKQRHNEWGSDQVLAHLSTTASPTTGGMGNSQYGAGLVDPYRAMTEIPADGEPAELADLATQPLNEAAQKRESDVAMMNSIALIAGLTAVTVFAAVLLGVAALRRGKKGKWKVRRVDKDSQVSTFDDGDPIPLTQGIKGLEQDY